MLALLALVLTTPSPTSAHPFGEPQTLALETTSEGVALRWRAATDDLTALAMRVGAVEPRARVYRDGALVPETAERDDAVALASSPRLEEYLLGRLRVSRAGETCAGTLVDASDLAQEGALLEYACPARGEEVELSVSTLLDIHPAYRTVVSLPGGGTRVFSAGKDVQQVPLTSRGAAGSIVGSVLTLVGWAGGSVLVAMVALFLVRHRRAPGRSAGTA